jgi:integrase
MSFDRGDDLRAGDQPMPALHRRLCIPVTFKRQILKERDEGLVTEPTMMTLSEFLDHWLETIARLRLRTSTYQSYDTYIKLYVRPQLGERRMSQLNALTFQSLYSEMTGNGMAPRTVRYTNSILNTAFEQAVKWRLISRNPVKDVELPRQKRKERNVLTPEEVTRFLEAAKSDRLAALFDLALATGMRPGEYLGLKWQDVDLEAAVLVVERTLVTGDKGSWRFAEPKTDRSRRSIPLPKGTVQALREHKRRQAEEHLAAGPAWADHELDDARLRVRQTAQIVEGAWVLGVPKTEAGSRLVTIDPDTTQILRNHLQASAPLREAAVAAGLWEPIDGAELVFPAERTGRPRDPSNLRRPFLAIIAKLGCRRSRSTTSGTPTSPLHSTVCRIATWRPGSVTRTRPSCCAATPTPCPAGSATWPCRSPRSLLSMARGLLSGPPKRTRKRHNLAQKLLSELLSNRGNWLRRET